VDSTKSKELLHLIESSIEHGNDASKRWCSKGSSKKEKERNIDPRANVNRKSIGSSTTQ
jgi:hypothetical protein